MVNIQPIHNNWGVQFFSSNIANDLVQKLPATTEKFGVESVEDCYTHINSNRKMLIFQTIQTKHILNLLKKLRHK